MGTDQLLISCDWGTSTFRLRLLRGAPELSPSVAAEHADPCRGIGSFAPGDSAAFADYLAGEVQSLFRAAGITPSPAPIWLSGMITSSLGWKQLPYARLPFALDGSAAVVASDTLSCAYGTHGLFFVSGLQAEEDVMRGEECELIGVFADPEASRYSASAVVVLPGTHSKCIEVCDARVTGFRTFLTGELFDVLCRHSILRHSVTCPDVHVDAKDAFTEGVLRAAEHGVLASLFSVRARSLLKSVDPHQNRAYLSGLLIGGELSAVVRQVAPSTPILLCGAAALVEHYRNAFEALGMAGRIRPTGGYVSGTAASLGHWLLHSQHVR